MPMLPEQQHIIITCLQRAVASVLPEATPTLVLERPKVAAHGDLATNVAMQLAKPAKRNPRELAQAIVDALMADPQATALIAAAELAGPGFINFRLTHAARCAVLPLIAKQAGAFGRAPRKQQKVLVEFVSANPTGPLHVGHARQAALGDALCRLFDASGFEVSREFYYNDAGNQIHNLAISVQARGRGLDPSSDAYPADGYKGDYILDVAQDFVARKTVSASDGEPVLANGDLEDLDNIRRFAVTYLRREQDLDLQAFGLAFDNYYLESSLYTSGRVEDTVNKLVASGHTYEHEGALWLRTTELGTGDDKDRVLIRSSGEHTYFLSDIAYHRDKMDRGFAHMIDIWGADHHGYVPRMKAAFTAHDLIDWVGRDAVRFFLIQRRADTEFVFDVDLARSQSEENPVYYIQYAHARICSMLSQSGVGPAQREAALADCLTAPTELALMQRLAEFPALVIQAAQELSPHLVAFWLRDCAADFHSWYNAERVLVDDVSLRHARLKLADATRQVLCNGLELLGVSAPQRM